MIVKILSSGGNFSEISPSDIIPKDLLTNAGRQYGSDVAVANELIGLGYKLFAVVPHGKAEGDVDKMSIWLIKD